MKDNEWQKEKKNHKETNIELNLNLNSPLILKEKGSKEVMENEVKIKEIKEIKEEEEEEEVETTQEKLLINSIEEKYSAEGVDGYKTSSWMSFIFFHWAFKLILLSNKLRLELKHFGKPEGNHKSSIYLQEVKHIWEEKDYKSIKTNALWLALVRSNLIKCVLQTLFSLVLLGIDMLTIILFRWYILSFDSDETRKSSLSALTIAVIFFLLKILYLIFAQLNGNYNTILVNKSNYQLICLIYEKVLKAKPATLQYKASEGEIINLMQVDAKKIGSSLEEFSTIVTSPFELIFYTYMLFNYFSYSAFFGLLVLVIFLFINYLLYRILKKQQKQNLKNKDNRMNTTNETINNLKFLKLYAWDEKYLEKLTEKREVELNHLRKINITKMINGGFTTLAPILVAFTTFLGYQKFTREMRIEDILAGLYVFKKLSSTVKNLPVAVYSIMDSLVSMERIEKYIKQEEIDYSRVVNENRVGEEGEGENIKNEIIVDDLSFSWGVCKSNEDENSSMNKEQKKEKLKIEKEINTNNKGFFSRLSNRLSKTTTCHLQEDNYSRNSISSNASNLSQFTDVTVVNELSKSNTLLENTYFEEENQKQIDEKEENEIEIEIPITLSNINLQIKKGQFIAIIGDIGAGKSSLVQAILNNLIFIDSLSENKSTEAEVLDDSTVKKIRVLNSTTPESLNKSKKSIIVNDSISYVSQVSWIENTNLKNNILFNSEYNEERYSKILRICELEQDIKSLYDGDLTEIGERGINLSGGQKARVALARAIYSNKEILILDDPISALDAHVSSRIMYNLSHDEELRLKTKILVTHALQFIHNCDVIIYVNQGRVDWMGAYSELKNQEFYNLLELSLVKKKSQEEKKEEEGKKEEENEEKKDKEMKNKENKFKEKEKKNKQKKKVRKLITEEYRKEGNVENSVYSIYILYMGGVIIFSLLVFFSILVQSTKVFSDLWVIKWQKDKTEENKWMYLYIYAFLGLGSTMLVYCRIFISFTSGLRSSKKIHYEMSEKIINAPINLFHDTKPKGLILNRFSGDVSEVDSSIPQRLLGSIVSGCNFISIIIICSIYSPFSLIFIPFLIYPVYMISKYYNYASLNMIRIQKVIKSPLLSLFSETLYGSSTIRAFNKEEIFIVRFQERVDLNFQVNFYKTSSKKWFKMMLGFVCLLYLGFILTITTIFKDSFKPGEIGILLSYSLNLRGAIGDLISNMRLLEKSMIAMERCLEFTKVKTEKPLKLETDSQLVSDSTEKSKTWPTQGRIEFKNYSVKYRENTEIVLKNLNFSILPSQKIAIVGRTGCGKSTLCLSLFRILEPFSGTIFIDGVDICNVGLNTLRCGLTIIPQDPALMKGSLRHNIDPFSIFSDEEIMRVVKSIGMEELLERKSFKKEKKEKENMKTKTNESAETINSDASSSFTEFNSTYSYLNLDFEIEDSGSNLSVGEKQLICICRALLRIVVLDEATANIDYKTERIIQKALSCFLSSSTLITIAHRINTIINYDKILVLDAGELVEYDSPGNLVQNKNSVFYSLVKKSNLLEKFQV